MEGNELDYRGLLDDPVEESAPVQTTERDDDDIQPASIASKKYEPIDEDAAEKATASANVLYDFLRDKGIEDPSKIKFENENGELEDVDFNSLDREEQMEMLKELTDPGLTDDEKNALNFMRQNRITLEQYGQVMAKQAVQNYMNSIKQPAENQEYKVDDYSDEELYLADMKLRYKDFTDDELLSRLQDAQRDEDLFKKEVDALRESYKAQEEQYRQDQIQAEQQEYQALQNNLMQAAGNFTEVLLDPDDPQSDSLEVEDEDRQQILAYLLNQDADGKSQLVKDIEDPNTLIQLAWLRLQGQNAIANTTQYWKDTLKETRKENAKLQKEIERLKAKNDNSVVVPSNPAKKDSNTMAGLFDGANLI